MTKRMLAVLLLGLLLVPALIVNASPGGNYFPLNFDNEWTYVREGLEKRTVVVSIDEVKQNAGEEYCYFKLNNYNGLSHWVRQKDGVVLEEPRNLWYWFKGKAGQSWTMQMKGAEFSDDMIIGSNGANLSIVSRNETVRVPAGEFNTIHIRFWTRVCDAGITNEWFAPGVGLVKRTESAIYGEIATVLIRAKIAGQIIGACQ
jgi:hypothetical protein